MAEPELDNLFNDILNEIEGDADSAKVIKQEIVKASHIKKSLLPMQYELVEPESLSLKTSLVKFVNSKHYIFQDLIDYCVKKYGEEGMRKAWTINSTLKEQRNMRADTIDEICEFLNVSLVIVKHPMPEKVIDPTVKRSKHPLTFNVDENDNSLKAKLIKSINEKNLVYQDLFDYCAEKYGAEFGSKKAYPIISALKEQRNIRSDTIDELCEFLNYDLVLEEVSNG